MIASNYAVSYVALPTSADQLFAFAEINRKLLDSGIATFVLRQYNRYCDNSISEKELVDSDKSIFLYFEIIFCFIRKRWILLSIMN